MTLEYIKQAMRDRIKALEWTERRRLMVAPAQWGG